MNYRIVNESKDKNNSFEFHKVASDGKAYGIFKECTKYYIKTAPADKELVAEAYDYIGGWNNRKDYEYESYAGAQKNFDLKMMSINEAYGNKVNPVSLDPNKKQDYIFEGTDKMKAELARQRQIMSNVNTILTEGSYIGVGDPERVSGSNDKDKPYTEKGEAKLDKDMPKASGKPKDQSDPYGDGKAAEKGKDVKDGDVLSDGKPVAAEHPSGGKVVRVNEGCEDGACNGCKDWGSEGIGKGNGDPKSNGWEMEGQEYVNEEINDAKDWDKGLPAGAGTGEADTDHNNDPFKETVNEGEEDDAEIIDADAEGDELVDEPEAGEGEVKDELPAEEGEDDLDLGDEEEPVVDEPVEDELGGEVDEPAEDELGGEEDIEDVEDEEGDDEYADLEAEIEELRAEIESLKAEVGAGDEEEPVEDEPMAEPESDIDLGDEDNGDDFEDVEFDDEEPAEEGEEEDLEEGRVWDGMKKYYNQGKHAGQLGKEWNGEANRAFVKNGQARIPVGKNGNYEMGPANYDSYTQALDQYNNPNYDPKKNVYADDFQSSEVAAAKPGFGGQVERGLETGAAGVGHAIGTAQRKVGNWLRNKVGVRTNIGTPTTNESKQAYMDSIVENVVRDILSEETTVLHDFGKHPGYRKKPMELPDTGSDTYKGMKDWNDDSVHSEEPFGQKIGDGKPYDKLVQVITDNVLDSLKKKD